MALVDELPPGSSITASVPCVLVLPVPAPVSVEFPAGSSITESVPETEVSAAAATPKSSSVLDALASASALA